MIRLLVVLLLAGALVAARGRAQSPGKEDGRPLVNSLGMRFVPVPIPEGRPVLMCVWKTRVKDFDAFVTDTHYDATKEMHSLSPNGKGETNAANWKSPGFGQTELDPVCGVNYEDAVAFCAWLSKKESRHYRLPTDHEWSCAVGIGDRERAGDTPHSKDRKIEGVYPWGTRWPPPKGAGNYAGEECRGQKSLPTKAAVIQGYQDGFIFTSPVGSFDANRLGLYDLGGNLWEWCDDKIDPARKDRVLRGGCWGDDLRVCLLSSFRRHEPPRERGNIFGFRVVIGE